MEQADWLDEKFEEYRPHLRAVAYRMLGTLSDADDAVQDAWLRFSRADTSEVDNLRAWLTTVVARVSLNMLRSRQTRREDSYTPQFPDPIIDRPGSQDPEHEALLADSVGVAERAQHAIGDGTQVRPVFLELFVQPVGLLHRHSSCVLLHTHKTRRAPRM